jgi:hypothetical protein
LQKIVARRLADQRARDVSILAAGKSGFGEPGYYRQKNVPLNGGHRPIIASVPRPGATAGLGKTATKIVHRQRVIVKEGREVERTELDTTCKSPHSLQINRCFDVVNTRHCSILQVGV